VIAGESALDPPGFATIGGFADDEVAERISGNDLHAAWRKHQ